MTCGCTLEWTCDMKVQSSGCDMDMWYNMQKILLPFSLLFSERALLQLRSYDDVGVGALAASTLRFEMLAAIGLVFMACWRPLWLLICIHMLAYKRAMAWQVDCKKNGYIFH